MTDPDSAPEAGEKPSPFELANQPAVGYRGKIIRPRGFLPIDSPARMRTDKPAAPAPSPVSTAPLSVVAVAALVFAFLVPPAGIVCGHMALVRTRRQALGGHGIALAATVLGYVFTILLVLFAVIWSIFLVAASNGDVTTFQTSS